MSQDVEATVERQSSTLGAESPSFSKGKFGTLMSFWVLLVGSVVSIIMQRYAPYDIELSAWSEGCSAEYQESCYANSAVLRISFALTLLFALQALGTLAYTKFYDILWAGKVLGWGLIVLGFYFAKSEVFGLQGYGWFARITGFAYLILQQIILLDMAYSWNEQWVAYSAEDGEKGKKWLVGILAISALLFAGSYALIGIFYWQFQGCAASTVIITLTLALTLAATLVQVFLSDEGSVLISAIMTAYAVYVCYSAVTLNPDVTCNPTLDTQYQTVSTVIGLSILVITVVWTTYNTVRKIPVDASTGGTADFMNVSGPPTEGSRGGGGSGGSGGDAGDLYSKEGSKSLFVQVSLVFLLVSGYYAMILTNWATEQQNDSQADPRNGRAAMWIQAAGQWIAILIYLWSLVAPKVLPDRDFGGA